MSNRLCAMNILDLTATVLSSVETHIKFDVCYWMIYCQIESCHTSVLHYFDIQFTLEQLSL